MLTYLKSHGLACYLCSYHGRSKITNVNLLEVSWTGMQGAHPHEPRLGWVPLVSKCWSLTYVICRMIIGSFVAYSLLFRIFPWAPYVAPNQVLGARRSPLPATLGPGLKLLFLDRGGREAGEVGAPVRVHLHPVRRAAARPRSPLCAPHPIMSSRSVRCLGVGGAGVYGRA